MSNLTHSYSSIKMFENCPLRYYEQRVAKSIKDEGGEASLHGERVHKSLELRVREDQTLPQDMAEYESMVQAVIKLAGGGPLYCEEEMTINRKMQLTGWWDKDAWLRTKIDVLIMHPKMVIVCDYKTGKRRVDMFQMRLYAAMVMLRYPEIMSVKCALVWLRDKALDTEVFHRTELTELWKDVLSRIVRIEQAEKAGVWPAKPSGLCPYCPLYNGCKFARKR